MSGDPGGDRTEPDGGPDPRDVGNPDPGPGPSTTPGGEAPAPSPGGPDEPLYKFGDAKARYRSIGHSALLVVGSFLAAIVAQVLVVRLLVSAGVISLGGGQTLPPIVRIVAFIPFYGAFFLVGTGYLRWQGDDFPFESSLFRVSLPSKRDLGWALAGFIGLWGSLILVSLLLANLGVSTATNEVLRAQGDPMIFLYFIPLQFLLVAPAEEFVYRGLIQGLFRDAYGVVPGILVATGVFGLVHYFALSGGGGSILATLAVIAVLGTILGALYEKTQNLFVPIAVHAAFNALQFYFAYLRATGWLS